MPLPNTTHHPTPQVIEVLVRKGSPVDTPNKKGWTPLHRAAYNGRKEAVAALVKLGADVNRATSDGNTPLHLASFMNQLSTMEKLCEVGASQRLVNKNSQRPYELCITDAARDILKGLMGFEGDDPLQPKCVARALGVGGGGCQKRGQGHMGGARKGGARKGGKAICTLSGSMAVCGLIIFLLQPKCVAGLRDRARCHFRVAYQLGTWVRNLDGGRKEQSTGKCAMSCPRSRKGRAGRWKLWAPVHALTCLLLPFGTLVPSCPSRPKDKPAAGGAAPAAAAKPVIPNLAALQIKDNKWVSLSQSRSTRALAQSERA